MVGVNGCHRSHACHAHIWCRTWKNISQSDSRPWKGVRNLANPCRVPFPISMFPISSVARVRCTKVPLFSKGPTVFNSEKSISLARDFGIPPQDPENCKQWKMMENVTSRKVIFSRVAKPWKTYFFKSDWFWWFPGCYSEALDFLTFKNTLKWKSSLFWKSKKNLTKTNGNDAKPMQKPY
jgi:hypothetical protein